MNKAIKEQADAVATHTTDIIRPLAELFGVMEGVEPAVLVAFSQTVIMALMCEHKLMLRKDI